MGSLQVDFFNIVNNPNPKGLIDKGANVAIHAN